MYKSVKGKGEGKELYIYLIPLAKHTCFGRVSSSVALWTLDFFLFPVRLNAFPNITQLLNRCLSVGRMWAVPAWGTEWECERGHGSPWGQLGSCLSLAACWAGAGCLSWQGPHPGKSFLGHTLALSAAEPRLLGRRRDRIYPGQDLEWGQMGEAPRLSTPPRRHAPDVWHNTSGTPVSSVKAQGWGSCIKWNKQWAVPWGPNVQEALRWEHWDGSIEMGAAQTERATRSVGGRGFPGEGS